MSGINYFDKDIFSIGVKLDANQNCSQCYRLLTSSFIKLINFHLFQILDEIYKILQYVESTPSLNRAYKVTDELFDLSTMAMEYFKEHIEPSLPEVTYFATDVFEYPAFSKYLSPILIIKSGNLFLLAVELVFQNNA